MFLHTPSSAADKPERNEDNNVSFWLEKLHAQEEYRVNKENGKNYPVGSEAGMQVPSTSRMSGDYYYVKQTPEEKGMDEFTKKKAIKNEADKQLTDRLIKTSNRCIISISSVFPWNLFPNTINVEEDRVTFIFRQFMATQSHSVDIKDISNVFIESSYFAATLQIVSRTFVQNDIKIGYLNKHKAIRARMMIEGLRTLLANNIDTSIYSVGELLLKMEEMHRSQGGVIH